MFFQYINAFGGCVASSEREYFCLVGGHTSCNGEMVRNLFITEWVACSEGRLCRP